jgi:hypothetical protein
MVALCCVYFRAAGVVASAAVEEVTRVPVTNPSPPWTASFRLPSLQALEEHELISHPTNVLNGQEQDSRWGFQKDDTGKLSDENLNEWLFGLAQTVPNVLFGGFEAEYDSVVQVDRPKIWIVSNQFMRVVTRHSSFADVKLVQTWGRSTDFSQIEQVVVPIHHAGLSHWTVIIAHMSTGILESIDSMWPTKKNPKPHETSLKTVAEFLDQLKNQIKKRAGGQRPKIYQGAFDRKWKYHHSLATMQINNRDCGLCMMINIMTILRPSWSEVDCSDMRRVRVWMYQAILRMRHTRPARPIQVKDNSAAKSSDDDLQLVEKV